MGKEDNLALEEAKSLYKPLNEQWKREKENYFLHLSRCLSYIKTNKNKQMKGHTAPQGQAAKRREM